MIRPHSAATSARHAFEPLEGRTLFAAGAPDTTFGGDGIVTGEPADFIGHIRAIDVQPDGRVVAAGTGVATDAFGGSAAVVRFNTNGSIDRSFGSGGVVRFDTGDLTAGLSDVRVLPDGDVVAVGTSGAATLAVRLNADGSRDTAFGANGVSVIPLSSSTVKRSFAPKIALEVAPSGALLLAGEMHFTAASNPFAGDSYLPAVARLTPAGALDPAFGGNTAHPGLWHLPLSSRGLPGTRLARDVVLQPNGRILVTGDTAERGREVFVARLSAAGRPDVNFSGDGVHKLDFNTAVTSTSTANAIAVDRDGNVLLAGSAFDTATGGGHFYVTRFTTSGVPDTTFADNGTRPFGFGVVGMPTEMKLQPDGKILVAGLSVRESRPALLLARLRTDGDMDYTFGERGRVRTGAPVVVNGRDTDMGLAPDGRIVLAANRPLPGTAQDADHTPLLARYVNDFVTPPQPFILEAEAATMRGTRLGNLNAGYTGAGYADYANLAGDYVEWSFTMPAAAERSLAFRYASGAISDRPLELRLNSNVLVPRLSFVSTGGWGAWSEVSVRVQLAAGTNRVRLTTVGFNGPNIDSMTVR